MSVEDKKLERCKAKRAVTVASRRLIGAVNRDSDYDVLKGLMIDLEKAYDDFCDVNEEYEIFVCEEKYAEHRIVNGEDVKTYRDNVNKSYQDARSAFSHVKDANTEIARKQVAGPVIAALKNNICRIHELITVIDQSFEMENVNSEALQLDKNDLQSILNVICDNMTKLCSIESQEQDIPLQKEVDEVVSVVYNRIRKINLFLHEQKSVNKPFMVGKPNFNGVSNSETNEVIVNQNQIDNSLNVIPPSTNDTATSTQDTTSPHTPIHTLNTTTPLETPVTTNLEATSPHTPIHTLNMTTPLGTQVTTGNVIQYGPSMVGSPSVSSTSLWNTSAQIFAPTNTVYAQSIPRVGSLEQNYLLQQSQTSANYLLESVPVSSCITPSNLSVSQSNQPVAESHTYRNSAQLNSNFSTYPIYTSLGGQQPIPSVQSHFDTKPANQATAIRLKKMTLPTFSGLRKDWPEFKAVWKSIAETANYNRTALAHELKKSVKGEAKLRIKSVYVTKPEAYDVMWEKLEQHYEDTSASVQAALEDLRRLKPVREEDYKGLVELVDEVESVYSQLEELKRLTTLTMRDVDFISDLLPTHLKIDWRRKYRDLSPDDKLQPFTPFMKFLERERGVVARLAEIQHPNKRGNSNHIEGGRKTQPSRIYHKCAFPTHRKDTTERCKSHH